MRISSGGFTFRLGRGLLRTCLLSRCLAVPGKKDKRREVRAPSFILTHIMKRFLLSLVALVITSVCFAQDIIVQKDGSTIQAKVLKVSQSEVEYKKFGNLEGPTYTISTKDLQCINYENGTKDTFVSQNYNPNIVTNETATQFSNDEQLLKLYNAKNPSKKAKTMKIVGWVGAPIIAVGTFLALNLLVDDDYIMGDGENYCLGWTLPVGIAAGAGWWSAFYFSGRHIEKKHMNMVQSSPIYQQEFKVGKTDRLMVGVDMLKDNTRKNQTLGLGVSYNF